MGGCWFWGWALPSKTINLHVLLSSPSRNLLGQWPVMSPFVIPHPHTCSSEGTETIRQVVQKEKLRLGRRTGPESWRVVRPNVETEKYRSSTRDQGGPRRGSTAKSHARSTYPFGYVKSLPLEEGLVCQVGWGGNQHRPLRFQRGERLSVLRAPAWSFLLWDSSVSERLRLGASAQRLPSPS